MYFTWQQTEITKRQQYTVWDSRQFHTCYKHSRRAFLLQFQKQSVSPTNITQFRKKLYKQIMFTIKRFCISVACKVIRKSLVLVPCSRWTIDSCSKTWLRHCSTVCQNANAHLYNEFYFAMSRIHMEKCTLMFWNNRQFSYIFIILLLVKIIFLLSLKHLLECLSVLINIC